MVIPSKLGSLFSKPTVFHDEVYLWLDNDENVKKLVEFIWPRIHSWKTDNGGDFTNLKTSYTHNLQMERPVFGYNNFLIGKVDALITLDLTMTYDIWRKYDDIITSYIKSYDDGGHLGLGSKCCTLCLNHRCGHCDYPHHKEEKDHYDWCKNNN
jgi:hypothetical protein